ncbi:sigma-70 family RNA polymerase sigma factor [Clostridium sp.]|uniref:sigma-70 family RNA polymerase sigma factor n=1 Tax=Clostridium sp. TaxID=1506 RepID=UPI002847013D|nr:sigma-70 family RNA polymerase sigma factor [Clostridium sp.]MDR3596637.1 sigma-70 family RNA polymerase sigma factor [Clostridium sp.]
MNYDYIEQLVANAKDGDLKAKENLIKEFTPLINSLSIKTFIQGYEKCDIKNECFLTLFNCIHQYNFNTHRFVAYATNAIKNNLNTLLIRCDNRKDIDGFFSLSDDIECNVSLCDDMEKESLRLEYNHIKLLSAIKNKLSASEKHLIIFIFFMKNTLTNYAYYENISYVTASKRKKRVLEKLKTYIIGGNELWELMI